MLNMVIFGPAKEDMVRSGERLTLEARKDSVGNCGSICSPFFATSQLEQVGIGGSAAGSQVGQKNAW